MDKETLYLFFGGNATIEQEKLVLTWLEESSENKKELLEEREFFDAVLMYADEESLQHNKLYIIPNWIKEVLKIAAIVLIVLGIGLHFVNKKRNELLARTNTILVPAGQRVNIILPDGTKVCLNSLSELEYPTFFIGKKREVKLKGEAFFDVTHNEKIPFVVKTKKYDVEVLGTAFDVDAYPNSKEFSTSLIKGKVKVTNNDQRDDAIYLSPNEQVYILNGSLVKREIPDMNAFVWREGILQFNGDSFQSIMEKVEKSYGLEVIIRRYPTPENEFFGKIRISYGVEHVLKVLQKNTQFKYRWDENMRAIYIE